MGQGYYHGNQIDGEKEAGECGRGGGGRGGQILIEVSQSAPCAISPQALLFLQSRAEDSASGQEWSWFRGTVAACLKCLGRTEHVSGLRKTSGETVSQVSWYNIAQQYH